MNYKEDNLFSEESIFHEKTDKELLDMLCKYSNENAIVPRIYLNNGLAQGALGELIGRKPKLWEALMGSLKTIDDARRAFVATYPLFREYAISEAKSI